MLALQALNVFDAIGESFEPQLSDFLRDPANLEDLGFAALPSQEVLAFAQALAAGSWRGRARYDALLARNVAQWSVERMQPVDRNILRLGLFELLEQPETPHQVVLNEAVELAKIFGGAESPAFVNGVLDGIRRALLREGSGIGVQDSGFPGDEGAGSGFGAPGTGRGDSVTGG